MVSAVITTHNRVELLGRSIASVLNQTYKDLELIVVSDGSTDGTDEFMKRYDEDPRVQYISYHPGRGGNYARNTGIKASKGEFVAFLDDDDEWLPTKIEEQLKVMASDPEIGLVYTGTRSIYVDEGVSYNSKASACGDLSKRILYDNVVGSTTTVMVRKRILERSGLFDEELAALQDYDLWVRICQVSKVGVVPAPMVNYYNYNSTGQIAASIEKNEASYNRLNEKYATIFKTHLTAAEFKSKLAGQKRALAMKALRAGDGKTARKYLRESLGIKVERRTVLYYIFTFLGYRTMLKLRSSKD